MPLRDSTVTGAARILTLDIAYRIPRAKFAVSHLGATEGRSRAMLAVVFNNRAPYFAARLRAAARRGDLRAFLVQGGEERSGTEGETLIEPLFAASEEPPAAGLIASRVREALAQARPEVVAVHGWSRRCALAALSWAARTQTPAVMLSEFQAVGRRPGGVTDWVKRRLFRYCGAVLTGGRAHAEYLAALGVPRERVFLGYDVVDNGHFARGAAQARQNAGSLREGLNLPGRYFLAVSRLAPEKNLLFLLDAYAAYRSECGGEAWKLVIAGDGPFLPQIMQRRHELGLDEDVRLAGWRKYTELPAYYGLASVFVHSSVYEPWGLVVNEAMAAGLPVLVSNACSCAPDLVAEGENGHTFDPRDVVALARHLACATRGEYELAAMGRKSAHLISAWSAEAFADRLWAAAALARSSPSPRLSALDRALIEVLIRRPGAPS
jgi:glycosyltransferase involved in cell wall biosynthesis